jgi:hypothetical protein
MQVEAKGILQIGHLAGTYPREIQPTLTLTDYMLNCALGNCVAQEDMLIEPLANCAGTKPIFVPHNTRSLVVSGGATAGAIADSDAYLDANLPDWMWDDIAVTGANTKLQAFQQSPHGNQQLTALWDSDAPPLNSYEATVDWDPTSDDNPVVVQGVLCFISRTIYNKVPTGSDATFELRWVVHAALYSLRFSATEGLTFRVTADLSGAGGWKNVSGDFKPDDLAKALGNSTHESGQAPIAVRVRLLNTYLLVNVGNVPLATLIDGPGDPPVLLGFRVLATNFNEFSAEPHMDKWHVDGTLRSNPQEWGFAPLNTPYYYVTGIGTQVKLNSGQIWHVGFPSGSKISVDRVGPANSDLSEYDLEITNTATGSYAGLDYADATAVVARVSARVDKIVSFSPTPPRNLIPKDIFLQDQFDQNGMTIHQGLRFTMDNIHGQWAGQSGDTAIALSLGLANPSTGYFPRFAGRCGRHEYDRPSASRATVSFCPTSLMRWFDVPLVTVPIMDFWNHYYAMFYLAEKATFDISQMAFASLVPSDPYSAAPGDPNPYFLPAGTGSHPWTPRGVEGTIRSLADYVRGPTGFLLYVDAQGFLRYEKWIPPTVAATKRIYTEAPTGPDGAGLTEYWNYHLTCDNDQTRNNLVLVGIDSFGHWQYIVTKRIDRPSIYALPGEEPANYKGFADTFVWSDSRFASKAYAARAADTIFQLMRLPGIEVQFTCWLQPDIYPMDVIMVEDPFCGFGLLPLYVMSHTIHWAYQGSRQIIASTISAKYIQGEYFAA